MGAEVNALAAASGRLFAMATDRERIEAARTAAAWLADRLAARPELGGSLTYADSVGGVVTYWPGRDPRHVQTSPPRAATISRRRRGNVAAPVPLSPTDRRLDLLIDAIELDRLRSRPWRP